jgi:arylsulfatase A-like enzyme
VAVGGKFHTGNNQSGNPPVFHRGVDGRSGLDEWGFSDGLLNAGKNQATILMRRHDGVPQDPYMAFLADRGLAELHVQDYQRRNGEGVWTATAPTALPDDAYFDTWITGNGLELLDRAPSDRPWYLEVNLQNPHHPWDITESMHALYRSPEVDFPLPEHCTLDVPPEAHQEVRRNYAAMVEHLDGCLGRLLGKLEERGELDRTLIVYSSDHGEMLGDYDQWQKLSPLQASAGVPLVIAGPGVAPRGASDAPASIVDLAATFLDCAGLELDESLDSRTMKPFLAGDDAPAREVAFSGLSAWRMAFDGRYKLVRGYDPALRRGGDQWEPMRVPVDEAARWQRERPPLLLDSWGDERLDVSAEHPDVMARLDAALDEQQAAAQSS